MLDYKKNWMEVLAEYDTYLEDYVYEKIWSELSGKDKKILAAMCAEDPVKVRTIREKLGMTSNDFTVYRNRLLKKGIVSSPEYGYLTFTLPRFREFVQREVY